MKPTPTILPFDQSALWLPVARHGSDLDARAMPSWFKGWGDAGLLRRVLTHPGKYVFISEPFGADRGAEHYLFNEADTARVSGEGLFVSFCYFVSKIIDAGKVPVLYMGTPRTHHDEYVVAGLIFRYFDYYAPGLQFALDAASGMGTDSATWRVVNKYGGPERFWIEAHPEEDKAHWKGYRVITLANVRRIVEAQRAAGNPVWTEREHGPWAFKPVPGFAKAATLDEIKKHGFVLTPGRYVGAEEQEADGEPFTEKYPRLLTELEEHFAESERLTQIIRENLRRVGNGA